MSGEPQEEYNCQFVEDVATGDLCNLSPKAVFKKVWRMKNIGTKAWPEGTLLSWTSGDKLDLAGGKKELKVKCAQPNEVVDIEVELVAPPVHGRFVSYFRMILPNGRRFGHRIWADIVVKEKAPEPEPEPEPEPKPEPQQQSGGGANLGSDNLNRDYSEEIGQLEMMGFAREVAYPILVEFNGNVDDALNKLLTS